MKPSFLFPKIVFLVSVCVFGFSRVTFSKLLFLIIVQTTFASVFRDCFLLPGRLLEVNVWLSKSVPYLIIEFMSFINLSIIFSKCILLLIIPLYLYPNFTPNYSRTFSQISIYIQFSSIVDMTYFQITMYVQQTLGYPPGTSRQALSGWPWMVVIQQM